MGSELAERIAHLPKLYQQSEKSTAVLLKEAGLPEAEAPVTAAEIEDTLQKEPELANLWLERRHDQRFAGGWAIECEDGAYRVRSYRGGPELIEQNRLKACAEFIARYVSFIREALRRSR
jgi:hypothetical protein